MSTQKLTCTCGHSWEYAGPEAPPSDLRKICPVCTAASQETLEPRAGQGPDPGDAPGLVLGQVLAGCEVLGEISRGGMGVIYKARQQGLNRLVALKVIAPERLGSADALSRFQREVQAAALLSHPNIVTVFATDLTGPLPYLAMEYVAGIDLLQLVHAAGPGAAGVPVWEGWASVPSLAAVQTGQTSLRSAGTGPEALCSQVWPRGHVRVCVRMDHPRTTRAREARALTGRPAGGPCGRTRLLYPQRPGRARCTTE